MTETVPELTEQLRAFVRRRVRDAFAVDDIVQDVLTRLWQHRDAIDEAAITSWVFTVARSAVVDHYRARGRAPAAALDDDLAEPSPEAPRELAGCMLRLLETLPQDDRELLRRVDVDGQRQTDLAAELGLSNSGLKSRVQRARAKLRQALADCCRFELDRLGLPGDDYEPGCCPPR